LSSASLLAFAMRASMSWILLGLCAAELSELSLFALATADGSTVTFGATTSLPPVWTPKMSAFSVIHCSNGLFISHITWDELGNFSIYA